MKKQHMILAALGTVVLGSAAYIVFFRGASQGDNDMKKTADKEQMPKAEATKEVFKKRESEPSVGALTDKFNKDMRTDTGVAVVAATDKFQDHHSLDEGVDSNAPHVDPGHIRNAAAKEVSKK